MFGIELLAKARGETPSMPFGGSRSPLTCGSVVSLSASIVT